MPWLWASPTSSDISWAQPSRKRPHPLAEEPFRERPPIVDIARTSSTHPAVHFIVVLAPLTAVPAIVCALWAAARRHLTWLVLVLAAMPTILTPLMTDAGEWLEHRTRPTPPLRTHTELGGYVDLDDSAT